MGLINPKPRFAYDDATDQVYDYIVQKDFPLTDKYIAPDGVWNLKEVKRLILAGQPCEAARIGNAPPPAKAPPKPLPQPGTQAAPSSGVGNTSSGEEKQNAPGKFYATGLSVEQLQALKLSPLQCAALGLTRSQLDVTGVPASTIAGWDMNEARANALKLTAEQRAALMPA